ncbi:MAG TPA: hypothetical protein VL358_04450 [Caulobacteraceae bacterium]|nr:hypothetical protein [Caulobacteraceae bacterium]
MDRPLKRLPPIIGLLEGDGEATTFSDGPVIVERRSPPAEPGSESERGLDPPV